MPALLTSLTAVERLAAHANTLPPEFVKALAEDLEYARFGAALPELPCFGDWKMGVGSWLHRGQPAPFTRLFVERAPVAFGLKAAELVSNGALVGTEPGLAFIAGYFTQLCVTRALEPIMSRVLVTHRKQGESELTTRRRLEWTQALFLLQELHGSTLVGTSAVRGKLQLRKRNALAGIGRGMYELIRVSSQEAFGEAPRKLDVDSWMRGLAVYSVALGSPLGRLKALPSALTQKELYRGDGVDVFAALDEGLEATRELLVLLGSLIRRNSFTSRSRLKVLELLPEGAPQMILGIKPRKPKEDTELPAPAPSA